MFSFSFLNPVLANYDVYSAARSGNLAAIQRFLKEGKIDINERSSQGYTLLHYASDNNRPLVVEFLLKNGATIDSITPFPLKFTPLHLASEKRSVRVVPILIKYGADVNAVTASRKTPLHLASISRSTRVASILIKNKADVNAKDILGYTPLHYASIYGLEIVIMLVENGADIKVKTDKGWFLNKQTPLGVAMKAGNKAVIKYLKSKGATE